MKDKTAYLLVTEPGHNNLSRQQIFQNRTQKTLTIPDCTGSTKQLKLFQKIESHEIGSLRAEYRIQRFKTRLSVAQLKFEAQKAIIQLKSDSVRIKNQLKVVRRPPAALLNSKFQT